MTDTATGSPRGAAPPPATRPRRPLLGRVPGGVVATAVAGLLALLLNVAALRSGDRPDLAFVAAVDLPAGTPVTPDLLRPVEVGLEPVLLEQLVRPGSLPDGYLAARAVAAGALVRLDDLRRPATPDGRRAMSIPIERAHAVGGDLRAGDLVDVIELRDGTASYVVTGAEILAVDRGGDGALGALVATSITIGVDASTALCLAAAIRGGQIEIVRSTGADPVDALPCTTPGT